MNIGIDCPTFKDGGKKIITNCAGYGSEIYVYFQQVKFKAKIIVTFSCLTLPNPYVMEDRLVDQAGCKMTIISGSIHVLRKNIPLGNKLFGNNPGEVKYEIRDYRR